jgi:hypothetical protein
MTGHTPVTSIAPVVATVIATDVAHASRRAASTFVSMSGVEEQA